MNYQTRYVEALKKLHTHEDENGGGIFFKEIARFVESRKHHSIRHIYHRQFISNDMTHGAMIILLQ